MIVDKLLVNGETREALGNFIDCFEKVASLAGLPYAGAIATIVKSALYLQREESKNLDIKELLITELTGLGYSAERSQSLADKYESKVKTYLSNSNIDMIKLLEGELGNDVLNADPHNKLNGDLSSAISKAAIAYFCNTQLNMSHFSQMKLYVDNKCESSLNESLKSDLEKLQTYYDKLATIENRVAKLESHSRPEQNFKNWLNRQIDNENQRNQKAKFNNSDSDSSSSVGYIDLDGSIYDHAPDESIHKTSLSQSEDDRKPLQDILNERKRICLIGDGGSGKTSFVCQQIERYRSNKSPLKPIFMRIKTAAALYAELSRKPCVVTMKDLISAVFIKEGYCLENEIESLSVIYSQSDTCLLLDGLDEAPFNLHTTFLGFIGKKLQEPDAFCRSYCHVVISSRPYAAKKLTVFWKERSFAHVTCCELTREQAKQLVKEHFRINNSTDIGENLIKELQLNSEKGFIFEDSQNGSELVSSPLLLGLLCEVKFRHKKQPIPLDKASLYKQVLELQLFHWGAKPVSEKMAEAFMAPEIQSLIWQLVARLGYVAHTENDDITEFIIHKEYQILKEELQYYDDRNLDNYFTSHTQLLQPQTNDSYRFSHRTIQEYLMACFLIKGEEKQRERSADPLPFFDLVHWEKLAKGGELDVERYQNVFFFAVDVAREENSGSDVLDKLLLFIDHALTQIADSPSAKSLWQLADWASVAIMQWQTNEHKLQRLEEAELERLYQEYETAWQQEKWPSPIKQRATFGRVRGRLHALTQAKLTPQDIIEAQQWLTVEPPKAGFKLGDGSGRKAEHDDEKWHGAALIELEDYRFATKPVLVQEFRCFVEHPEGLNAIYQGEKPQWFVTMSEEKPASTNGLMNYIPQGRQFEWINYDSGFELYDHPVVGVDFYQAWAYCHWLSAQQSNSKPFKLPSEAHWEYAVRGEQGGIYPWGDSDDETRRNGYGSIGQTSTVGLYRPQDSAEQLYDVSGNVREWCNTAFTSDGYTTEYKTEISLKGENVNAHPVLRGGCGLNDPDDLRCAYRDGGRAALRNSYVGFSYYPGHLALFPLPF